MPALTRFGTAFCAVLFMLFLVPVAAAVGVDASATQHIAPAPLPQLIGLLGLAGLGIVVQLRAKDKDGNTVKFRADTESDTFADTIEEYVEAKTDEATRPLQAQLTAATEARDAHRDMVIDEIVRVRALAAPKGDDGKATFDTEGERDFLATLPADQLKLHFVRAVTANVIVEQKTSGEGPGEEAKLGAGTGDDDAWTNVSTK